MKNTWIFRQQVSDAGFDPRSSRIKDLGEHSIKTFVREFIQNSLDVRYNKAKPITISFHVNSLNRVDIESLKENLSEKFVKMFKKSFDEADLDEKEKLALGNNLLFGSGSGFSLVIREGNCKGLTGSESIQKKGDKSNYDALCRKVNTNVKEDSNSGGTWGKGSSIYTFSSLIRTWFAYSVLSEPNGDQKKRFVGRCQLAPFTDYTSNPMTAFFGEGWFCRDENDKSKIGLPLTNSDADLLAKKFGLDERSNDDYGTTFFIPAFNPNIEGSSQEDIANEFIQQVLMNWFIPLYDGKLIVTIIGGKQPTTIDKTYLDSVKSLKYKLEIMDWYYKDRPDDNRFFIQPITIEIPPLKKTFQDAKGIHHAGKTRQVTFDLVIRKLEESEHFDDVWLTNNNVALVRGENGMYINHHFPGVTFLSEQKILTESILFTGLATGSKDLEAKRHSDLFLAYAENPDHSEWCTEEAKMNSVSYLERFEDLQTGKRGRKARPTTIIRDLLWKDLFKAFKDFFQENREIETGSEINQLFQKLASLKASGTSSPRESIVSVRRNPRFDYPEIDARGRFIYHYILKLLKDDKEVAVHLNSAIESWEGEVTDFDELGIPEFEHLELFDDETGKKLDAGVNPKLTLNKSTQEVKVAIQTCSIINNIAFQNLQPKIKLLVSEN